MRPILVAPAIHPAPIPANTGPFYHKGGSVGILFLHGFSATAFVFKDVFQALSAQGYTCYAPLIAGHGTSPEEMSQKHWTDWCDSADTAYFKLAAECPTIFIIGASLGCLLACQIAARHEVQGLVLVAAPLQLLRQRFIISVTNLFSFFGLSYYRKPSLRRQQADLEGPLLSYSKLPITSIKQLLQFNRSLLQEGAFQLVTAPALIIHSRTDDLVSPQAGETLLKLLGSQRKRITWVTGSHDELHVGLPGQQIYSEIQDFIAEYA